MTIEWTETAKNHLLGLDAFLYERSPDGADRLVDRIYEAIGTLNQFPFAGRPRRVPGTREIAIAGTNYVVAYRIHNEAVQILAVMHGTRRWPRHFRGS